MVEEVQEEIIDVDTTPPEPMLVKVIKEEKKEEEESDDNSYDNYKISAKEIDEFEEGENA